MYVSRRKLNFHWERRKNTKKTTPPSLWFKKTYKTINQWRKLKSVHEEHLVERQRTKVETSSLRTLEIMPRNLNPTVRYWIPPQYACSSSVLYIVQRMFSLHCQGTLHSVCLRNFYEQFFCPSVEIPSVSCLVYRIPFFR